MLKIVPRWVRPGSLFRLHARLRSGERVAGGPFAGMQYAAKSVCGAHVPKLVGCYERELHGVIEAIIGAAPDVIIDVGTAEGYYAVGLALRLPRSQVIGFDAMASARLELDGLATANGVRDRIDIRGACDPAALEQALSVGGEVVICDVEGYEDVLLNLEEVPGLRAVPILVELHDTKVPGVTQRVLERFRSTHHVQQIAQAPRVPDEYVLSRRLIKKALPGAVVRYALNEFRTPGTSWAWLTPRGSELAGFR
jgi:hypothetical protein